MLPRQPTTRNAIPGRILATGIAASAVGLQGAYEHPVMVKQQQQQAANAAKRAQAQAAAAAKHQAAVAARSAKQIANQAAKAGRYAAHHQLRGATADSTAAIAATPDAYVTPATSSTAAAVPAAPDSTIADLSASGASTPAGTAPASSGGGVLAKLAALSTVEKLGLAVAAIVLIHLLTRGKK